MEPMPLSPPVPWVLGPGNTFQKRSVSSPAPAWSRIVVVNDPGGRRTESGWHWLPGHRAGLRAGRGTEFLVAGEAPGCSLTCDYGLPVRRDCQVQHAHGVARKRGQLLQRQKSGRGRT